MFAPKSGCQPYVCFSLQAENLKIRSPTIMEGRLGNLQIFSIISKVEASHTWLFVCSKSRKTARMSCLLLFQTLKAS
jgi:hypothetical protein